MSLDEDLKKNRQQRLEFVKLWAKYVREHDDKEWSRQQNVIIDSALQSVIQPSREWYLNIKGENYKKRRDQDR